MTEIMVAIAVFLITFLLGSIPWGLIISKVFYHKDIRDYGSGNIGTTNAMRTMGKGGGVAVFVLDFTKGLLSGVVGLIACLFFMPDGGFAACDAASSASPYLLTRYSILAISTMGCTLGHIFSPWLHFKGGKGIAVAIGSLFITFGPIGAAIEILCVFVVLVVLTRYVSVGSIFSAIVCPFLAMYFLCGDPVGVVCCALTGALVVWAHRGNIKRLFEGTERRVGEKKVKA